jgi:hypothetical protein
MASLAAAAAAAAASSSTATAGQEAAGSTRSTRSISGKNSNHNNNNNNSSSSSSSSSSRRRNESNSNNSNTAKPPLFSCSLDSTEPLVTLLSLLCLEKFQVVDVQCMPSGLKFCVHKCQTLRAKAYLKVSAFQRYHVLQEEAEEKDNGNMMMMMDEKHAVAEPVCFTTSLNTLLHCLQLFGEDAHVRLSYAAHGEPLEMMLTIDDVVTQCEIATLAQDEEGDKPDFDFPGAAQSARAVVASKFLYECFAELDVPGGEICTVLMAQSSPFLSMAVKGSSSSVKIDFPDDINAFVEFECKHRAQVSANYSLAMLRPCVRGLAKATQTNLRINPDGLLSLQLNIRNADSHTSNWVEFMVCPKQQLHSDSSSEDDSSDDDQ